MPGFADDDENARAFASGCGTSVILFWVVAVILVVGGVVVLSLLPPGEEEAADPITPAEASKINALGEDPVFSLEPAGVEPHVAPQVTVTCPTNSDGAFPGVSVERRHRGQTAPAIRFYRQALRGTGWVERPAGDAGEPTTDDAGSLHYVRRRDAESALLDIYVSGPFTRGDQAFQGRIQIYGRLDPGPQCLVD